MLRPIESNLSLYNVEQKASQIKDPNAHQFQAMQHDEIVKSAQQQAQTVQTIEKSEGDVKVRERREDPEERRRKKKDRERGDGRGEDEEARKGSDAPGSHGGLNFLA